MKKVFLLLAMVCAAWAQPEVTPIVQVEALSISEFSEDMEAPLFILGHNEVGTAVQAGNADATISVRLTDTYNVAVEHAFLRYMFRKQIGIYANGSGCPC